MKQLREFCFYSPPVVLFSSILLSFVIFVPITELEEYLPKWLRSNMGGWTFIAILMINTILSVLSISVVFNVFRFVRNNTFVSFITFFWAVILTYIVMLLNPNHPDFGFNLFIPLAFVIPQVYSFFIFRKRLKSGYFEVDL